MNTARDRLGVVLPIVLTVLLILGVMAAAIHLLSRQSYRNLGRIDGFLRATAVGEACFTRILERLQAQPWENRWFATAPDLSTGTWEEGRYTYLLCDVSATRRLEADLLVRADVQESRVVMFWRLKADPYTLSPYRRVRTSFFTYQDPMTPMNTSAVGPLSTQVDAAITERNSNLPWEQTVEQQIQNNPQPDKIPTALNVPSPPPPLAVILPPVPTARADPIGPRVTNPEPTPPTLPNFPLPTTGPTPPPGYTQTLVTLADVRANLTVGRGKASKVGAYLSQAFGGQHGGTGGTAIEWESERNKLVRFTDSCCPSGIPTDTCSSSDQDVACKCYRPVRAMEVMKPRVDAVMYDGVRDCIAEIDRVAEEIDRACQPPGPTRGQAEALIQRGRESVGCADDLCGQARSLVSEMNGYLSQGNCPRSVTPANGMSCN